MTKQIIMYKEEHDQVRTAEVSDDTFTIVEHKDGSFDSMTYFEWEALRCRQASCAVKKEIEKRNLDDRTKQQILSFFDSFTDSMQVKFLEGNRSWAQIYEELSQALLSLA